MSSPARAAAPRAKAFRRPPTAQEAVLGALRDEIATGVLAPGERIVQDALAERYGVSRVPLREALRILEGEGRVVYHPHRGYVVAALSLDDLREVYRLRELLEAEALRSAVPRLTDADVGALAGVLAEVESADDLRDLAEANRRFHFALFEASDRPRLVRLLHQLWDATDAYRAVYFAQPAARRRVDREHRALLRAIRARDADAVVAAQSAHREHSVAALAAVLADRG
ncbi:MAG: GntR family transcriptional regulator [Candidatus Nanopelagicales bacterium]